MKDRDSLVSLLDVGQLESELHSVEIKIGFEWNLGIHLFLFNSIGWKTFGWNYTYIRWKEKREKMHSLDMRERCFIIDK